MKVDISSQVAHAPSPDTRPRGEAGTSRLSLERFHLRPATPTDEEFVNTLTRSTMRPYVEATWPDRERRERYYAINAFNVDTTRIACDRERDIGRLSVHNRVCEVSLDDMHVIPEMQGMGIGTWLLDTVIAEAGACGLGIVLILLQTNPARRLYERVGFEVYGDANFRYQMVYRGTTATSG